MGRHQIRKAWPLGLALSATLAGCAGTGPGLVSGPSSTMGGRLTASRDQDANPTGRESPRSDATKADPADRPQGRKTPSPAPASDRVAKYFPMLNRDKSGLVRPGERDLWADSARSRPQTAPVAQVETARRGRVEAADPETSVLPVSLQVGPGPDGVSARARPEPVAPSSPPQSAPSFAPVPTPGPAETSAEWVGPIPSVTPNGLPGPPPPVAATRLLRPRPANTGRTAGRRRPDLRRPGAAARPRGR